MFRKFALVVATTSALTGAAHADSSIYVFQIVGADRCGYKTRGVVDNETIRRLVYSSEQQLGQRMLAGEFTSEQAAAWKKKYETQDRATFCKSVAEVFKTMTSGNQ